MSSQQTPRPNKPKPVSFTPEEWAIVQRRKRARDEAKVEPEWLMMAEFGLMYGYDAIRAVLNNEITGDAMGELVKAGRKVQARHLRDQVGGQFAAAASAAAKKPVTTWRKLSKKYDEAAQV